MARYEVVKVITYWRGAAQSNERVGWLLRDLAEETECVYTIEEAWDQIHQFGAINAEAKIRTSKTHQIQEIEPDAFFYDPKWRLKYEDALHYTYSRSCLEKINTLVMADDKWKIKLNKDKWRKSHNDIISTWRQYKNIITCIDLAEKMQYAENTVIFVGASVWKECGLFDVYADNEASLELDQFALSIQESLIKLGIEEIVNPYDYIELPYVFEFIKIARSLNKNTTVLFEGKGGIFPNMEVKPSLSIAIGVDIQADYYIGIEKPCHPDAVVLLGPITPILKEVESHFKKKGRMICDVCGEKVAQGVYSSSIAPVALAYCYSCSSRNGEAYGVVVVHQAIRRHSMKDYQPSPYVRHVIEQSLDIAGKTRDQFEQDVEKQISEMTLRESLD